MKKHLLIFCLSLYAITAKAQQSCDVEAFATSIDILCGDTINLAAIGEGITVFENDFDGCNIGTGWNSTQQARYDDPCNVDKDGTCYLWFGDTSPAPRQATTNALDLSTGGVINFSMRYAVQGNASPCEGPDLPDEGVSVEYSINGGATWNLIEYYPPNGGTDPTRTSWTVYPLGIPAAAQTTSTQLRWIQNAASGAGNDHWGLEDIEVVVNPPNATYTWQHTGNTLPTGDTPPVVPTQSTTYTVDYTFGGCTSQASVSVNVAKQSVVADITPMAPQCPGDTNQLTATTSFIPPDITCGLSTTGCVGNADIATIGTGNINNNNYRPLGIPFTNSQTCIDFGAYNGNFTGSGYSQYIIRANEFPAFFKQGQIASVTFDATDAGTWNNFSIRMGCSNKNAFASANQNEFVGGLVEVYAPKNTTFVVGQSRIDFDQAFDWDGQTNIVIQICWFGDDPKSGNFIKSDAGFNSALHTASCFNEGGCGFFRPSESAVDTRRPNMIFDICYRPDPDLQYTWTPDTFVEDPDSLDTDAYPESTTEYTIEVWDKNTPRDCAVTDKVTAQIQSDADFTPTGGTACFGTSAQLFSGLSMGSVQWSGPNGFNSNDLDPIINPVTPADTGLYSVTSTSANCGPVTKSVRLDGVQPPNAGTPSNTNLCNTDAPIDLFNFISGQDAGGTWTDDNASGALSGSMVDPTLVNTANLPGTFDFTYTVNGNACPDATATVSVSIGRQASAGTGGDFTYCESQGVINIFNLLIDNPEMGGTWQDVNNSGQLNGDMLDLTDLGFEQYTFIYTVASSSPCPDDMATLVLTIEDQPDAGRDSSASICSGTTYNLFNYLTQNTEQSGQWMETTNSGAFNPNNATFDANNVPQGQYEFFYLLASKSPCINDTAFISLKVFGPPVISDLSDACEANNLGYRVTFRITGGDSLNYSASFPGNITASSPFIYTSDIIPSGQTQTIDISDPIGCNIASITVAKSCQCVTDAGAMRTDTLLNLCEGDSAFGIYMGGYMSDVDDTLVYYLHRGNGNQLSMPVDSSHTPNFEWNNSRLSETLYYISSAAANNRGDDWLDRADLCFDVAPGTPVIWHELPDADIDITPSNICQGDNATLTINALNGSAPFTYDLTLNPGGNQTKNASTSNYTESITPSTTTTYTLDRVSDNFGCTVGLNKSATVNINVAPTAQITTAMACSGNGATFNVDLSGDGSVFDFTYTNNLDGNLVNLSNQSGPTVTITPTVFDSNAVVQYTLSSVSDNSGSVCPGVVSGTFDLFPTPSLQLLPSDGVYCQGNPIPLNYYLTGVGPWQIDASDDQGGTYSFNVNTRTGNVNITNVLAPGNYVISFDNIVDMASGCSASGTGSANITVNPGPLAEVKITNPITGNPEDMVQVCENNSNVDLVFTKTQGNGTINVDYTRNGNPEGSITISGTSQTVTLPNNLLPGTYNYMISAVSDNSPASCVGSGNTVTLVVNPTPTVVGFIAPSESEICNGDAFTFQYDVTGNGTISFDLINQFGDVIPLTGNATTNTHTASITPSNLGLNNYSIINVSDGSNPTCTGTSNSTFSVDVKAAPTAIISSINPSPICFGQTTDLNFTTTGDGNITVNYSNQDGSITGMFSGPAGNYTETLTGLTPGSYVFSITGITSVSAQTTCSSTSNSTISLIVNPLPNASPQFVPGNVTCFGDDVRLDFNFNPVSYPVTVYYNDGQGNNFNQTYNDAASSFINVSADVSKTITIDRIVDANGCESMPNIQSTLTVNPLPTATLFGNESVCEGLASFINIDLQGNAPFTVQYQDDMGNIFDTIITNTGTSKLDHFTNTSTNYSLISVSDASNPVCSNTSSSTATINISPKPIIDLQPDAQVSCAPFNVNILNISDAPSPNTLTQCTWTLSNGIQSNDCNAFTTTLNNVGNYDLTFTTTNDLGCTSTATLNNYLRVNPDPVANFTFSPDKPDITASFIQFYNKSSGAASFNWYINEDTLTSNNPQYQAPTQAGSIINVCLEAVSNFGCLNILCDQIIIRDLELVYMPNSFTPDGDGINDVFRPSVLGLLQTNYILEIYNRWGELVFKTTLQEEGWDGTFQGEKAQSDNYTVILKGISRIDGKTEFIEYGNLNLIR